MEPSCPAKSKLPILSILEDLPTDGGATESTHCPQSPLSWAGASSLTHNSIGQESREARELNAKFDQAKEWL